MNVWGGIAQCMTTGWTAQGLNSVGGGDFPLLSRPALGPTQSPVQWVLRLILGRKATGAWV